MMGFMLEERCNQDLLVLVWTMRFCPVGLIPMGNVSGWEQSSTNYLYWCL